MSKRGVTAGIWLMLVAVGLPVMADSGPFAPSRPCWLNQPVTAAIIGSVGVAGAVSAATVKPVYIARQRAISALLTYQRATFDPAAVEQVVRDGKRVWGTGDERIEVIDHYQEKGMTYAYAVTGGLKSHSLYDLREGCRNVCNPARCSPDWLCNPMKGETAGFLGVSERATSLPAQYQQAIAAGIQQAGLLYGVKIDSRSRFAVYRNALGTYRLRLEDSEVETIGGNQVGELRFILTDACFEGSRLFVRVGSPDLKPLSTVSPKLWMSNPNPAGYRGAVGSAGRVASGKTSDQLELALKNALVSLAQTSVIQLTGDIQVSRSSDGAFFFRDIETSSNVRLKARVMGFFSETTPSGRRFFIWVVEQPD
jgi:hypothetical protein